MCGAPRRPAASRDGARRAVGLVGGCGRGATNPRAGRADATTTAKSSSHVERGTRMAALGLSSKSVSGALAALLLSASAC
mmetsp:Transcript_10101/g.40999  ORF Transcript_10101/g.40999 Transcript_10101/m.40999 type:complete len:80 (+) Transcript_10101:1141-1380(+)